MRIISTVPSQTELLADLGLDKEVVGITKFCVHPQTWFRSKSRIGGTKSLDIEKIIGLNPSLIIANKEENVKDQITQLMDHCAVHVTDIQSPTDNLDLIKEIGGLTDRRMTAVRLQRELRSSLDAIIPASGIRAAYLIWKDPYMTVGRDTYISATMELCGLHNIYHDHTRYPEFSLEELKKKNPEVILLSSEPFPFKSKHLDLIQKKIPDAHVCLVDGEAFSWYGTRLIKQQPYLNKLISSLTSAVS